MNSEWMPPALDRSATGSQQITRSPQQWLSPFSTFAIVLAVAALVVPLAHAQTFTVLYNFTGTNDAWNPVAPVLYANGNLFGTSRYGNNTTNCKHGNSPSNGCGTVFEINASGETLLHVFTGTPDGEYPEGGLVRDSAGNFYGTTLLGGFNASSICQFFGCGTVYKIDGSGNETILYAFTGSPDGYGPIGNLIMDAAGNFYGVTASGGAHGFGTVFKVSPLGVETVLYSFSGPPFDGATPQAGLVMDATGNFYGTTEYGGNATAQGGTVFKLDPAGNESVLYNFADQGDGYEPMASLFLGARGNLYGTAFRGGFFNRQECSGGCGTLYKIDPAGNFSVLHRFKGGADGGHPLGSLIRSKDGKFLYGTTTGLFDQVSAGTVFRFGATGETILYGFPETFATGGAPSAGLTQDSAGNLYGTTVADGLINFGTVFKITP